MQKIISVLLTTLILTVLSTVQLSAAQKVPNPTFVAFKTTDSRVLALERVFTKHNSPLAPFAKNYVETADKYELDWRLLPAIAGLESSFGNAQLKGSYNSYGWGGGRIYFNSVEDGIETVMYGLKTNMWQGEQLQLKQLHRFTLKALRGHQE